MLSYVDAGECASTNLLHDFEVVNDTARLGGVRHVHALVLLIGNDTKLRTGHTNSTEM